MLVSNLGFVLVHFDYKESSRQIWVKIEKWSIWLEKFHFRYSKRCSFLIWLLILLVLYINFNWRKGFADRTLVKSKNGLFGSESFKLSVKILKLLLIFILACVCVCLRPFTVKASSVWNSWNAREQINDVVLKTFLFSAKFPHRSLRIKYQVFLTKHFILFKH